MQKLTYTNLAGESAIFGGSPPYILAHIEGTENADISRKTFSGAMQDGKRTMSLLREDRSLDLTLNLYTLGRESMYHARQRLCDILGVDKAFDPATGNRARVTYQNDLGTWWTWAMPERVPVWSKRVRDIHPNLKLSFSCDSPYWFSMQPKSGGFDTSQEAFHFPMRFAIRFCERAAETRLLNGGHAPAPMELTLRGQGETPALVNRTTGKRLALTSPLPVGSTLRISTDPDDLYVRMVMDGEETNAFGLLDVTTPLSDFVLAQGENVIAYDAGGPTAKTAVSVVWRDRFEGV